MLFRSPRAFIPAPGLKPLTSFSFSSGKQFKCTVCDYTAAQKPQLLRHMEQHASFKVRAPGRRSGPPGRKCAASQNEDGRASFPAPSGLSQCVGGHRAAGPLLVQVWHLSVLGEPSPGRALRGCRLEKRLCCSKMYRTGFWTRGVRRGWHDLRE